MRQNQKATIYSGSKTLYVIFSYIRCMDLQAQKIELIQLLLNTTKPSIIGKVKNLLVQESDSSDFWDELNPELQSAIDKSLAQADAGNLVSHEDVMSKHSKWA